MTRTLHSTRTLYPFVLLGILFVGACSKSDDTAAGTAGTSAPAAAQNLDQEVADVASYRLTMDKFDKYYAAQRNIMLKAKDMSPADRAAMKARSDARENNNASMDDMVRNIESEPMMKDAIRDAGLSPREFATFTMAMMTSAMAAGVAKMRPNDNQDSLIRAMQANPDNVKFMIENEALLASKQKELEAEMKRLGIDDES